MDNQYPNHLQHAMASPRKGNGHTLLTDAQAAKLLKSQGLDVFSMKQLLEYVHDLQTENDRLRKRLGDGA